MKTTIIYIIILAFTVSLNANEIKVRKINVISSSHNEVSPVLNYNEDLLLFSSDANDEKKIYGAYFEKNSVTSNPFLIQKQSFYQELDINSFNTDAISLYQNDEKLIFSTIHKKGNKTTNKLYYNRKLYEEWTKSEALPDIINSNDKIANPSVTADGKLMFFASSAEGSVNGSMDIWYAEYEPGFDKWSEPRNFEKINTEYDETSPYIASDGNTLFFSSKGYQNSIGGYDIYYIKRNPETKEWGEVQYLPAPINSKADDITPSFSRDGSKIFFSSNRDGQFDIYYAELMPLFSKPITLNIDALDVSSGDKVLVSLYVKSDDEIVFSRRAEETEFLVTDNIFKGRNFIDLLINANNPVYKQREQTIRLFNNQIQDRVSVTMLMLEDGEEIDLSKIKIPFIDGDFEIISDNAPLEKITAFETLSRQIKPILNYIFFEENSSLIPRRYNQTKLINGSSFDERLLANMNTIDIYYQILNIIGHRMQLSPSSTIELIGYNSNTGKEKNNKSLSESRANTVAEYLINTWNIEPSRIDISFGNLPKAASSSRSKEGIAENRRVEIIADNELLSPILINWKIYQTLPKEADIVVEPVIINSDAKWDLNIYSDNKLLKTFHSNSKDKQVINWNIPEELSKLIPKPEIEIQEDEKVEEKPEVNEEPEEEKKGFFSKALSAIDKAAGKVGSFITQNKFEEEIEIDTTSEDINSRLTFELLLSDEDKGKYITKYKNVEFETKKPSELDITPLRYDVFSFISFDFGKESLTDEHNKIMSIFNDLAKENSTAKIYAYSDIIGSASVNLELSKKRANSVANAVKIDNKKIIPLGQSVLLFDNALPEGRMYSRTVIIELETPIAGEKNED